MRAALLFYAVCFTLLFLSMLGCNDGRPREPRPQIVYRLTVGESVAKVKIRHRNTLPINECIIEVYESSSVRVLYRDTELIIPIISEGPIVIARVEAIHDISHNYGFLAGVDSIKTDRVNYYIITVTY